MSTTTQHSRIRGRFMISRQQHAPDGAPVQGTYEVVAPWQDNLLLNSGLDNLGDSGFMRDCRIGAGSTEPSPSDTALTSQLGQVARDTIGEGASHPDYSSAVATYVFPPGAATGIVAELGVGPTAGALTTRSLVKDEEGNPTTIVKGPIDSLTVTYEIREYPDKTDTTSYTTDPHSGQEYTVVSRTFGGTALTRFVSWEQLGPIRTSGNSSQRSFVSRNAPLVAWDASVSLGSDLATPLVSPYIPGNHYRDVSVTMTEGQGNLAGGISQIHSAPAQSFRIQASFSPPIDKDNTKTLTVTFRKSWGRYVP